MTKKRKQGIEFHIKSNDYFGTLATVLDLMRQTLKGRDFTERENRILKQQIDDLMYLQQNHSIRPLSNFFP